MVLPAAGKARRFGSGKNKIWTRLVGRTVLEWTLSAFNTHPAIASIVLVAGSEELEEVQALGAQFSRVHAVVCGGETRASSVKCGLDALPPDIDIVLVHDAARPLVSAELIDRVLDGVLRVGAAIPGLSLPDTVKRVDSAGLIHTTVPRTITLEGGEVLSGLTTVQTPQGARVSLLRDAYAHYDFAHSEPTDEASLLEALGAPVAVVPGDPANLKITRPEDVAVAERALSLIAASSTAETAPAKPESALVRTAGEIRTGFGYDVHAFAAPEAGRKLFLGGIEIAHDRGLEGHSDADVLLHAVCDALLGGASLGDIGILFPNTDPTYKGISSLRLLAVVQERLHEAGWQVINIDATVVAEAPKLMPHREAIHQAIADCLGMETGRISVKATTSEKMGFVGRREGIACWAVATLKSV